MTTQPAGSPIAWYRTPIGKDTLAQLNTRSDIKGFVQAVGHLGLLCATGGIALYGIDTWPWWAVAFTVFVHGTVGSFLINAVHELGHKTVFRTQTLNAAFVRVFAFLGWINFEHFTASHKRHHQFTLHPPDDLEVVLPIKLMMRQFFLTGVLNPQGGFQAIATTLRHARGSFTGEWEERLFPETEPERARPIVRWARVLLGGHAAIAGVSLVFGWWLVPVLTSLLPFYGGWLFFLCNNTQHIGLQDNVPDFRLCCRTFTANPVVEFLYWHMNFHTEHHMYAGVPCYRLAELHRMIVHDLPACPRGLFATWREIAAILRKQRKDPTYQHVALLPG